MKKIFLIILLIFFFTKNYAQTPVLQTAMSFGSYNGNISEIGAIATDASGNVFVAGLFSGVVDFDPSSSVQNLVGEGTSNIYLVKYNASGAFVWGKVIGGATVSPMDFNALVIDNAGNLFIRGNCRNYTDFDPSTGTAVISSFLGTGFLAKYDASGNYQWVNVIPQSSSTTTQSLAIDNAGNVVLTGVFASAFDFDPSSAATVLTPTGFIDIFIVKYSTSGTYIFAKQLGGSTSSDVGAGRAITTDNSNNIYLTGTFQGTTDFDPSSTVNNVTTNGGEDLFFAKYTSNGDFSWVKNIGTNSGYTEKQAANAIKTDNLGNIYLAGYYTYTTDFDPSTNVANLIDDGVLRQNIFLAKYEAATGNYVWAKAMGGNTTIEEEAKDMIFDGSGNVIITGVFGNLADFDPSAATFSLTNQRIFLAKYDVSGNFIWAKSIGGYEGSSLALDNSGNIILSGNFTGTVDFDPSASTYNITTTSTIIFLSKFTTVGNFVYAFTASKPDPAGGGDGGLIVRLDNAGNTYLTANFLGTVDFDPSSAVNNLTQTASGKFIAKYDVSGNLLWLKKIAETLYSINYVVDNSGNIIVVGTFTGTVDLDPSSAVVNFTANGASDVFIAKYDTDGNYLWAKNISGTGSEASGLIKLDNTGNIFIVGTFNSSTDFDPSAGVVNITSVSIGTFVAKYNPAGDYLMAAPVSKSNSIPGFTNLGYVVTTDFEIDANGSIFTAGYYWHSGYFDPANNSALLYSSSSTGNDNDAFVAKYTPTGAYQWVKKIAGGGGDDRISDIVFDNTGNFYATGLWNLLDYPPPARSRVYLAKFDNVGVPLWSTQIGGSGYSIGNNLVLDNSSNLYLSANFRTSFDFIAGTADDLVGGNNSSFLAKYTTNGVYVTAYALGTNSGLGIGSIAINSNDDFVMTGSFAGTIDFDFDTSVYNLVNYPADYNVFLAKYSLTQPTETINTGNWATNGTWNTNTPPTATKTAKINAHTVSIPNAGNQVKKLQMNGGIINLNGGTLEIKNQ